MVTGSLLTSLVCVALLATNLVTTPLNFVVMILALTPGFLLIAIMPQLNHEARLVDSYRAGLLHPEFGREDAGQAQ